MVVKEGDVSSRQPADVVLEIIASIIREIKLVVFTPQAPDNRSGLAIDLGDFRHMPAGNQEISVLIQLHGIDMDIIRDGRVQVESVLVYIIVYFGTKGRSTIITNGDLNPIDSIFTYAV